MNALNAQALDRLQQALRSPKDQHPLREKLRELQLLSAEHAHLAHSLTQARAKAGADE